MTFTCGQQHFACGQRFELDIATHRLRSDLEDNPRTLHGHLRHSTLETLRKGPPTTVLGSRHLHHLQLGILGISFFFKLRVVAALPRASTTQSSMRRKPQSGQDTKSSSDQMPACYTGTGTSEGNKTSSNHPSWCDHSFFVSPH